MDNKTFRKIFDETFKSYGFVKKGSNWLSSSEELEKLINLQKSNFANSYYVNYGFKVKAIQDEHLLMHIHYGLRSADKSEHERIEALLDLNSNIDDEDRKSELKFHLVADVIGFLKRINTESELLVEIKKLPTLNVVPLIVKKHFNLF